MLDEVCKSLSSRLEEELPVKDVNTNPNISSKYGLSMEALEAGLTEETASLLGIDSSMDRLAIDTENSDYYH
jgi:hypothetical protein